MIMGRCSCRGLRRGRDCGLVRLLSLAPVGQYFSNDYPDDLDYGNGQQRAWYAKQYPAHQNSDEDHQSIELDSVAVNLRLEYAALHLLVDHDVDEKHHGLPWCDEQAHDDEQRPAQCCADKWYEV